jgi:hypothetical protein
LADLFDVGDLNKKEDGESKADEEDDEKADDGLMVCHLFDFPVFEEQVDEFVLYLDGDVLLLVRLSICDHYK